MRLFFVPALLSSAAAGGARRLFSGREIDERMRSGRFDRSRLLRNAVPYSAPRLLEENGNDNYYHNQGYYANNGGGNNGEQDFEITGDYRLQFDSCLSMKVENYNLMMDNLVEATLAGQLHSIQNFIVFDVCKIDGCDDQQSFIVDLETFLESMLDYVPAANEAYCEACRNFQSYCVAGGDDDGDKEDAAEDDGQADAGGDDDDNNADDAADQDNGNRRKLQNQLEGYAVLDCTKCHDYDCYNYYMDNGNNDNGNNQNNNNNNQNGQNNGNNNNNNGYNSVYDWIQGLAECRATGSYWNNINVYAGWMCNADGSGIEIGVFLDQYCTMYHNSLKFGDFTSNAADFQYIYQSQDIVPSIFNSYLDCGDMQNTQFVDQDTYDGLYEACVYNGNCGNNNNNNNDNGDANEDGVNAACQSLFQGGGFEAIDMDDCYGEYEEGDYEDGEEYAAQQQQTYQYMYQYNGNVYDFDISINQIQDRRAVCSLVAEKYSQEHGDIDNVFNDNGSGNFFDFSGGKRLFERATHSKENGLSPIAVTFLVLFAVVVTVVAMTLTKRVVTKRRSHKTAKKEESEKNKLPEFTSPEVFTTDTKKTPLIIS